VRPSKAAGPATVETVNGPLTAEHVDERLGGQAKSTTSKTQAAIDTIGVLAEWFPAAFAVYEQRRRPLKLGIDHDLATATAGAITLKELKIALGFYVGNVGYLKACVEGAARINLQGDAAGTVTPDEAKHARQRLKEAWARRKAKAKTQRPIIPAPSQSAAAPTKRASLADLRAAARARRDSNVRKP
jgi:sRNA-binding protein